MIGSCAPPTSATGRALLRLKRLQVFALLALHRWLPILWRLLA